jgi:hypothetical protein
MVSGFNAEASIRRLVGAECRPRTRSSERSFNVENPMEVGTVFGRRERPLRTDSRGGFG